MNKNNRLNLEAALRAAEAGMPVFPVKALKLPASRWNLSPVYPSGPHTATRSRDKIMSCWAEHTDAIPAIPCTSIVVIEADHDFMGFDGVAALEALIGDQDWPSPPVVLTPAASNTISSSPSPDWTTIPAPFQMELMFADWVVSLSRLEQFSWTVAVGGWTSTFRQLRSQNFPSG
jgi:hypothetical protein